MSSELIRKGGCFLGQGRWQKLQQHISSACGLKVEATSGVFTLCVNKNVQFVFRESSLNGCDGCNGKAHFNVALTVNCLHLTIKQLRVCKATLSYSPENQSKVGYKLETSTQPPFAGLLPHLHRSGLNLPSTAMLLYMFHGKSGLQVPAIQ